MGKEILQSFVLTIYRPLSGIESGAKSHPVHGGYNLSCYAFGGPWILYAQEIRNSLLWNGLSFRRCVVNTSSPDV